MKLLLSLVLLLSFGACSSHENKSTTPEVPETAVKTTEAKKEVAYGGHCGMGLCHKKTVKGNPEYNFEYKGKIYHFSSAKAREQFIKDIDANIAKADKHWENLNADSKR
jgi:YHS domain-containing protein